MYMKACTPDYVQGRKKTTIRKKERKEGRKDGRKKKKREKEENNGNKWAFTSAGRTAPLPSIVPVKSVGRTEPPYI